MTVTFIPMELKLLVATIFICFQVSTVSSIDGGARFVFPLNRDTETLEYHDLVLDRHRRASGSDSNSSVVPENATSATPTASNTAAATDAATDESSTKSPTTDGATTTKPFTTTRPPTPTTTAFNTTTVYDHHNYYTSHVYNEPEVTAPYLQMFKKRFVGASPAHNFLSNALGHVKLFQSSFKFLFYGHSMDTISITTAGFVYMSNFLHRYLAHSQYIAPLMGNFHTLKSKSDIYKIDDGKSFWVKWNDVYLNGNDSAGPFTFYMVLHKNGTVIFAYEKLPILPQNMDQRHTKIGLSDAFYWDTQMYVFRMRRIYRYHVIAIDQTKIRPNTIVIMNPLLTCHELTTCQSCLSGRSNFTCSWCSKLDRCSSGLDRNRQEWMGRDCHLQYPRVSCPVTTTTTTPRPTTRQSTTTTTTPRPTTRQSTTTTTTPRPTTRQSTTTTTTTQKPTTTRTTRQPTTTTTTRQPTTTTTTRKPTTIASKVGKTSTPISSTLRFSHVANSSRHQGFNQAATKHPEYAVHVSPKPAQYKAPKVGHPCLPKSTSVECQPRMSVAALMGVLFLLITIAVCIAALVVWCRYAYTHPSSPSGLWLLEHRPAVLKDKVSNFLSWRSDSPGERYQVSFNRESTA